MAQMTPAAWLEVLEAMLDARQPQIQTFLSYRDGAHRLRFATAKFRQAFGGLFREFADNWCEVIVEAPVERLRVQGFRFGEGQEADDQAWSIWQANNMDAAAGMVHRESVTCGEAYWLVEPRRPGAAFPRITAEHPTQCVVACDPGDRRLRQAGLKRWIDRDGFAYANIYLPDQIAKFRSSQKSRAGQRNQWVRRPDDPGGHHDLGAVPLVPLPNSPDMLGGGRSDLRNAIPLQDAINKTLLDMLVASEFGAFRQRVVLGVEAPQGPNGEPIADADIRMAMSKLLMFSESDAKIAEWSATDLSNYTTALEPLVTHLAAQTRTPPHYLLGQMVNISGDALKAAESGLTSRTREKHTPFGEGHEEAMRLAFRALGDETRGGATRAETIWSDPEVRNQGELVDALIKLRGLNIPDEILWEKAGFTPTEIARIKEMQALDSILVEPRIDVPITAPTATVGPGGEVAVPAPAAPARPAPGPAVR